MLHVMLSGRVASKVEAGKVIVKSVSVDVNVWDRGWVLTHVSVVVVIATGVNILLMYLPFTSFTLKCLKMQPHPVFLPSPQEHTDQCPCKSPVKTGNSVQPVFEQASSQSHELTLTPYGNVFAPYGNGTRCS